MENEVLAVKGLYTICTELRGSGYPEAADRLEKQAEIIDELQDDNKVLQAKIDTLEEDIEVIEEGLKTFPVSSKE